MFKPTGEKVEEGFRYFTCSADELMQAFSARDIASIAKLPFALDEDGEPDTSAVCLDIAYTPSGAFVAAQPTEYRDHVPTRIAPVIFLEGAEAQALKDVMPSLDQSSRGGDSTLYAQGGRSRGPAPRVWNRFQVSGERVVRIGGACVAGGASRDGPVGGPWVAVTPKSERAPRSTLRPRDAWRVDADASVPSSALSTGCCSRQ